MGLKDDLIKNVADIIAAKREIRDGRKVPVSADVGLIGVAVQLDAVFYTPTCATRQVWQPGTRMSRRMSFKYS